MNATPTPEQASDLLAQVDATQRQARSSDAWPLVMMLFVLSGVVSVSLVAVGILEDNMTQLIILCAGLAWLIPSMIVYISKALSWSRRSTVLLLTWLPLTMLVYLVAIVVDSYAPTSWVPFAAAGLLWIASPIVALVGLRR
ncbi:MULTISPECIES: hypothetical protein [unclassified Brevibacterium]|uniref:hypothetical protein n=1 Tax=unclassified Brevibacterium TaxID=2614124 RepID=UPI001E45EE87|nr:MULTISPECIES: hypothetical protein [unclassified Brevibacterium]MCD1287236.1 hypothetical protein [Brevibacterium sp. CCUG 69071]MDK8436510.1 hypothetical protein [Brevibacterium sp. H-BE7]